MRVGFLTHLLWDRYGPFWTTLTRAAGAEVVLPSAAEVVARLADPRVGVAPAVAFRVAIAAGLALEDVDLLVVPELNTPVQDGPGAAQDPWIAALPTMLRRSVPGLPAVWSVPASLEGPVESHAVTFLHRLTPDAGTVRRAWSQHRAEARPPRRRAPREARAAPLGHAAATTVRALCGQAWWATRLVADLLVGPNERWVGPYLNDPSALRAEGRRLDPSLIDTDAEALGAVRRSARSSEVAGLCLVIDGGAGSDLWLARRAEAVAPGKVEVYDLRRHPRPEDLVDALLGGGAPAS